MNPRWVTDTDEKHGQKAKRGFTYYDVTFGILNNDGTVDYYGGRLVVRMDENNNDYFYDVDLYNHTKKEASLSAARQANDWDTSDDNVTQHNNHVKNSEKVGYHAGDLGKSEPLSRMDGGRGTGHFGTGTYFVGDPEKIKAIMKSIETGEVSYKTVYTSMRAISMATGIPISAMSKELVTIWNNTIGRQYPDLILK